jgi:hypothetical protein
MRSRTRLVILAACLTVALVCLAFPVYVIRPVRPQGPTELNIALLLLRARLFVIAAALLLASATAFVDWRLAPTKLRKFALAAVLLLITATAGLSRVNIFEKMFHPIDAPAFQPAAEAALDPTDKLLTVKSRAYPIRALAYHHIVNDTVEGVPLVGTY